MTFLIQLAHRFAWLEGNEAFTDSTGQATFKDLTVNLI